MCGWRLRLALVLAVLCWGGMARDARAGAVHGSGLGFCCGPSLLTDAALPRRVVGQRQVIQANRASGQGDDHIGKAELDLLVLIGDLVEDAAAGTGFGGELVALIYRHAEKETVEAHATQFT